MSEPLSREQVVFEAVGLEQLHAGVDGLRAGLVRVEATARDAAGRITSAFSSAAGQVGASLGTVAAGVQKVGAASSSALSAVAGGIVKVGAAAGRMAVAGALKAVSAGAGLAARGIEALNDTLKKTQAALQGVGSLGTRLFAGGLGLIGGTAAVANPVQFERLGFAFRDLAAVVGEQFEPVVERVIETVYRVADALLNLSPEIKQQASHWVVLGTGVGGALMVLPRVASAFTLVTGAVRVFSTAMVAMNLSTGGVLVAIGAVVSIVAALVSSGRQAGGSVGGLMGVFQRVGEQFRPLVTAFGRLWESLEPVFVSVGDGLVAFGEAIIPALTTVVDVLRGLVDLIHQIPGLAPTRPGGNRPTRPGVFTSGGAAGEGTFLSGAAGGNSEGLGGRLGRGFAALTTMGGSEVVRGLRAAGGGPNYLTGAQGAAEASRDRIVQVVREQITRQGRARGWTPDEIRAAVAAGVQQAQLGASAQQIAQFAFTAASAVHAQHRQSAFGRGGGGQASFGSLQSAWQNAVTMGLRDPASRTADNTARSVDLLRQLVEQGRRAGQNGGLLGLLQAAGQGVAGALAPGGAGAGGDW